MTIRAITNFLNVQLFIWERGFFTDDIADGLPKAQSDAVDPELIVQKDKKGIAPYLRQPHQKGIGHFNGDKDKHYSIVFNK